MQKWARRLGGWGVSFLSGAFFSKAFQIADFVHGLPGSIDDSSAWKAVIAKVSLSTVVYASGIIGGLLLATSEWWWPRFSRWIHRTRSNRQTQELVTSDAATLGIIMAIDPQIKRFKELEPLITRHRKARRPRRDIFTPQFWNTSGILAFRADLEELIAELDALRIPHPCGDADRAVWFNYMVRLDAACRIGDLEEARSFYPSGSTTP